MERPLVSIITPCYNAAQFIAETIESVLAQTYTNWEMIIVDDCSTDCSAEIINEYVAQDNRIKYYKTDKPSGGPIAPRNIALEKAQGEYIAFLDADDLFLPHKIERQLKLFQDNIAIVFSNYEKIDKNGSRNNRIVVAPKSVSYRKLLQSGYIGCCTMMCDVSKVSNMKFSNIGQEDWAFQLDILRKGYIAVNTNTVESLYRIVENSRSSQKLKVAKGQWYVLKNVEKLTMFEAIYYFCHYAIKGTLKFFK